MGLNPAATGMSLTLRIFLGRGDIIYIVSACKYNEQMLKIKTIAPLFLTKITSEMKPHAERHINESRLSVKYRIPPMPAGGILFPGSILSYTNSRQSTPPLFFFPSFFKGRGFPSSSRFSSSSLFTASSFPT